MLPPQTVLNSQINFISRISWPVSSVSDTDSIQSSDIPLTFDILGAPDPIVPQSRGHVAPARRPRLALDGGAVGVAVAGAPRAGRVLERDPDLAAGGGGNSMVLFLGTMCSKLAQILIKIECINYTIRLHSFSDNGWVG